jgi:hypothetical protein
MGTFNYLPGLQITTLDGGLSAVQTPTAKSTVIVGTAGIGPADVVYQVNDPNVAVADFGFEGSLIKGLQEVTQGGCDNVYLFRMGTQPAVLSGVGAVMSSTGVPVSGSNVGFTLTFGLREADTPNRYQVNYDGAGTLIVFLDGNIVWSNVLNNAVDTGDTDVEDIAVGGLPIQSTSTLTDAFSKSLSLTAAAALAAVPVTVGEVTTTEAPPVLVLAKTGLGLTQRQVYVALAKAFNLVSIFPVQEVHCPDAVAMNPGIQFKASSGDVGPNSNDPATNPNALDWLNTTTDANGDLLFHWASESTDSAGSAVAPVTFTSVRNTTRTGRLDLDYHEVCFEYLIARFCAEQSQNQGGCEGFIGFAETSSYGPVGLRNWIGFRPKLDAYGNPMTAGKGLCGDVYLVGTVSSALNSLVADCSTKTYRIPGMYRTLSISNPGTFGEYDEGPVIDANGWPTDIGAYLNAVGDWAYVVNGLGTYRANLAGITCGYSSQLDPKSALTNKALPNVSQIYQVTPTQLDQLTAAKVNMLRFKGSGVAPALLHDYTCANGQSDFIFKLRMQIKFLVCSVLFQESDKFIGRSSTDGLTLAALKTALDKRMVDLQQRSYIAGYTINIRSTLADRRIGRLFLDYTFDPPDEAVQIMGTVAIGRSGTTPTAS